MRRETECHFPVKGAESWVCPEKKLEEWTETYPEMDVPAELRKALQWLLDNPGRQKTPRGMPAFLGRWLGNAQNRGSYAPKWDSSERAEAEPYDPNPTLEKLAQSVPDSLPRAEKLRAKILELRGCGHREVEEALQVLDRGMLKVAKGVLADGELEEMHKRAWRVVRYRCHPLAAEAAAGRLVDRLVREGAGLPLLSLWGWKSDEPSSRYTASLPNSMGREERPEE